MDKELSHIFARVQKSESSVEKYQSKLDELHKKNPEQFCMVIMLYLPHILKVEKQETSVDRLVHLVSKIAISYKGSSNMQLYSLVLDMAVKFTIHPDKFVRQRACSLISQILENLPGETEISGELMASITEALVERTKDKIQTVRVAAIGALEKMQDQVHEDPVTMEYLRLLRTEPNKEIRCAVLTHLKIHKQTIDAIVERLHDVDKNVREKALDRIGTIPVKYLKHRDRVQSIDVGLKDRDDGVKTKCLQMCQKWLSERENRLCNFLKLIRVTENVEVASLLIKELIPSIEFSEFHVSNAQNYQSLSPEFCLAWRLLCEHLENLENHDALEKIVPDVPHFSRFVTECIDNQKEFEVNQLLLMSGIVEKHTDDAGQKILSALLREILVVNATYVAGAIPHIVDVLMRLSESEKDFIRVILDSIQTMVEPLYMNPDISIGEDETCEEVLEKLKQKQDELAILSRQDNFGDVELEAAQHELSVLEYKLGKLSLTPEREKAIVLGSLIVFEEFLKRVTNRTDELIIGLKDFLFGFIPCADDVIRSRTITCLGLYALFDEDPLFYVNVFKSAIEADPSAKVHTASIRALFDIFLVFGSQNEEFIENGESVADAVLEVLYEHMVNENAVVRRSVCEGFIKLAFTNNFVNEKILASLIFALFNPSTAEEDPDLFQCLSLFFPSYSFHSILHQNNMVVAFSEATLAIFGSQKDTVLGIIDLQKYIDSMMFLTDPDNCLKETVGEETVTSMAHNALAISICFEILSQPTAKGSRLLCKALSLLKINFTDKAAAIKIKYLVQQIEEKYKRGKDKISLNAITKFLNALNVVLTDSPELTEDEAEPMRCDLDNYISRKTLLQVAHCMPEEREERVEPAAKRAAPAKGTARKAQRKKKSESSEDESDDAPPPEPRKTTLKRGTASRQPTEKDSDELAELISTESNSEDESFESKPVKKKKLPSKTPLRKKLIQVAQLETEIDDLLMDG